MEIVNSVGLFFVILSSLGVLAILVSRQTIYALLWLISTLIFAGAYFVINKMDAIGLVLIIVYVGAVSMLFLYMVMLSDNKEMGGGRSIYQISSLRIIWLIISAYILLSLLLPVFNVFDNNEAWLESNVLENSIIAISSSYSILSYC